ncbi:NADH-quinone oxidoreductase subunit G [Endobacter medicaginis]|uniref:NADH-quinone oxidoreductase n=1 Tax=Endobacter medicaginis TaxID=1181271 RepID=A0A850NGW0_9PROT|nr:NADH-quinone oxidoreductase subunit NuoG [Endobacter medicaginis]MBB3173413.1 NADH-quinone oxidoreductase subunit G [Endobacter medicaginis]MCX5475459.1 NADH-quinone oxidoreductase subunit NuoG [Endobacter medicaginis]NVN28883.1 NADH-quinone oxidoreductase subunit G [Endobacter medicaginis]
MVKVTIDGIAVDVPRDTSVLQACEVAGREIPRFCYHERLSVAGNCRMCLVAVERAPKLIASCSYPVAEGMVVRTDTEVVRRARRAVMEFLLINHPLDCPICDQGGECDLQDQAFGYGADTSRYAENKRAVKDKYLGPIVKTVMTRCIQCTRCVRFATEVAGVPELGATSRGENMEIGTYVERALTSELSGNLVDICPVGALTSKPYAFTARPWELKKTDAIDVVDGLGTNIRVDARGAEVLRILPRVNDEVNEEWLSDKGRHTVDGLRRRRLDSPWVRVHGKLHKASWEEAFISLGRRLAGVAGDRIGAIAGDLCDAESLFALKELLGALGSTNLDCRQDGATYDVSRREFYTFGSGIAGIDEADALLLVGSWPRHEAPVLNARIRRRWLGGPFPVGQFGVPGAVDQTYAVTSLGETIADGWLDQAEAGFAEAFRAAKKPMVIVGAATLARPDGAAILARAWGLANEIGALTPEWNGFNVLQTAASRVAGLDMGFLPGPGGQGTAAMLAGGVEVLFLLGADEIDAAAIPPETFVVYLGHHGDRGAARADLILPGAAYVEKDGTWVNTEGRVQRGFRAIFPPGEAREDWRILRALSAVLNVTLPFDTLEALRAKLEADHPSFGRAGLPRFGMSDTTAPVAPGPLDATPLRPTPTDYYLTNPISRASPTMAECAALLGPKPALEAAE